MSTLKDKILDIARLEPMVEYRVNLMTGVEMRGRFREGGDDYFVVVRDGNAFHVRFTDVAVLQQSVRSRASVLTADAQNRCPPEGGPEYRASTRVPEASRISDS